MGSSKGLPVYFMNTPKTIAEPSPPSKDCPEPHLWKALDCFSTEFEVIQFIMYLTRAIKPKYVIETGTCFAYTTNAIATALERGKIVTCDPEKQWIELHERAEYLQCPSLEVIPTEPIDLLFLDSLPELRVQEYFHFKPYLSPRAVVVIHDTGESHQELRDEVKNLLLNELDGLFLPTPRGLFIGRPKN